MASCGLRQSSASRSISAKTRPRYIRRRRGKHLEAAQQGLGLGAAVGLDHADHHVDALPAALLRRLEHRVGLADARIGAEEDLEPAAPFLPGLLEQRFGGGPALVFSHPRPSPDLPGP